MQQIIIFVVILIIGVSGNPQLSFLQPNRPGNVAGNNNGVNNNNLNGNTNNGGGLLGGALNRQGGLSFVIPGLSLLAGGGNNGGGVNGNIFGGTVTVTRTLVSTVTTVTTPSFRTCTASAANNVMPCAAGRKRRDEKGVVDEENKIDATPVMELIIGGTTLIEREAVSEFLEAHKPSTQSVIYPPEVEQVVGERIKINPRLEEVVPEGTTVLYPSLDDDLREEEEREEMSQGDEAVGATTETPVLLDELVESTTLEPREGDDDDHGVEFARGGFGRKTTTVTTVIRVTSVATSLATGSMATLTIMYAGCLPPSLPVSGTACTP